MKLLRSPAGGFLRRTIGFRSELVVDAEDHETFAVTGGSFQKPEGGPMREWDDATAYRKPKPRRPRR